MGRDNGPRLFGLLVTHKRHEALESHLDALAKQTKKIDHLLVVDNGPSGVESDLVFAHPEAAAELEYLAMPDNLGPAGALGRGMAHLQTRAAPDDYVVLLDDDDPPWREEMLEQLYDFALAQAEHANLGMVGRMGAGFDYSRGRIVRLRDDELAGPVAVDYVGGSQLPVVRMAAVEAIGGFDEELFFGFDDLEYGLRLRKAGYDVLIDGDMGLSSRVDAGRLGNAVGAPKLEDSTVPWRRYYSLRNLIHILRSHGHNAAALRVTVVPGLGKSAVLLLRRPRRDTLASAILSVRAIVDGWTGRLGRRVEPVAKIPSG